MRRLDTQSIETMMKNKLVITGATGFLGKTLVEMYHENFDLVLLSRQNTEGYVQTNYNLDELLDITKGAHCVVHLAATRSASKEFSTFFNDIEISQNIFEACRINNIKNIVYASSISVYSDQENLPWSENKIDAPCSMYGASKLTVESIADYYNLYHSMNIKCLRFAHLFGALERNNYMINLFLRKAFLKKEIVLSNLTDSKREFLYIKDAASAIISALKSENHKGSYNIGSGIILTNEQVAKLICNVFENEPNLSIDDSVTDSTNTKSSYMSSIKAQEDLNWVNSYDFISALTEIKLIMEDYKDVPEFY